MCATNVIWTNDDLEEYNRQLKTIRAAYPDLPDGVCERRAADIVNAQKGV